VKINVVAEVVRFAEIGLLASLEERQKI
jgi:hypothetical protein